MQDVGRTLDADARRARAERILDAASELLLRLGYKRVTVEDVAEGAGIGKGTIYLHWKSREALFYAVIEREYLAALDEYLAALRRDPEEALLHRMMRTYFLVMMRRPLLRAAFVGDMELLGRIAKAGDTQGLKARGNAVFDQYLRLLHGSGLLRADNDPGELLFALGATSTGYFLVEVAPSDDRRQLPLERRADLLAATIRRAFEPPSAPAAAAVHAVAPRVVQIFNEIADLVRAHLARAYA